MERLTNRLVYRWQHNSRKFVTFEDGISSDSDEVYYGLYYQPGEELIGIMGNYVQMDSCQNIDGNGLNAWYQHEWCLNKMRETIKREFGNTLKEYIVYNAEYSQQQELGQTERSRKFVYKQIENARSKDKSNPSLYNALLNMLNEIFEHDKEIRKLTKVVKFLNGEK
jgi:hypothetical protein